jgi:hypothetical protein
VGSRRLKGKKPMMNTEDVRRYFRGRPQGSWLRVEVTRDVTTSDIRPRTDAGGVPQVWTFAGAELRGKPKFVLVLPVNVLASSDGSHPQVFAEGTAGVWLRGNVWEALRQAMIEAGVVNPGKVLADGALGGAIITMQTAGVRPSIRSGFAPGQLWKLGYASRSA